MSKRSLPISLLIVATLAFASLAQAEPVITLPLAGYYRPGKFFPVHITADKSVSVRIDVENGIGARAEGTDLLLPVMLLSENERSVRVTVDDKTVTFPVSAVDANTKLALVFGTDLPPGVMALFPNAQVHALLAREKPKVITQTYESADAFLDYTVPTTQPTIMPRFAETTFGPSSSLDDPAPYDALSGFVAARTPSIRRTLWLCMAVFSILSAAIGLLARRWTAYIVIGVAAAWVIVAGLILGKQPAITERDAVVFDKDVESFQMADVWSFRSALDSSDAVFEAYGRSCRPLFAGQARVLNMWIDLTGDAWRFHYTLPRGTKVGFFCSDVKQSHWPQSHRSGDEPIFEGLVRRYYSEPGKTIPPPRESSGGSVETWVVFPARQ